MYPKCIHMPLIHWFQLPPEYAECNNSMIQPHKTFLCFGGIQDRSPAFYKNQDKRKGVTGPVRATTPQVIHFVTRLFALGYFF